MFCFRAACLKFVQFSKIPAKITIQSHHATSTRVPGSEHPRFEVAPVQDGVSVTTRRARVCICNIGGDWGQLGPLAAWMGPVVVVGMAGDTSFRRGGWEGAGGSIQSFRNEFSSALQWLQMPQLLLDRHPRKLVFAKMSQLFSSILLHIAGG